MRADAQDMTELIVAFRNFVSTSINTDGSRWALTVLSRRCLVRKQSSGCSVVCSELCSVHKVMLSALKLDYVQCTKLSYGPS